MNQADFNSGGRLVERLLAEQMPADEVVANLFLAAYSRRPRKEELAELQPLRESLAPRLAYERILWVLLNSSEFRVYH
jgi:hypothetical protein